MTMEASALSCEINNSGYQGLTRIPRIYRKSPPKHHFYVRNFFAKTLENVDEWVKSVKSAVRYASLFVWLVVCWFLPSFLPSFVFSFVCLFVCLCALLLSLLHCWLPVLFSSGRDGSFESFSHLIYTFRSEMP